MINYPSGTKKANGTSMSPDLLALNRSNDKYDVFESKGYSKYNKDAIEHTWKLVRCLPILNGVLPSHRLAVMTLTGINEIYIIEKDPDGVNEEEHIDFNLVCLYHYLPIAELIMELCPKERGGRIFGTLEYGDDSYTISIPSGLYRELYWIIDFGKESLAEGADLELFKEELKTYLSKSKEGILRVE